jgi:hypothetical protein
MFMKQSLDNASKPCFYRRIFQELELSLYAVIQIKYIILAGTKSLTDTNTGKFLAATMVQYSISG